MSFSWANSSRYHDIYQLPTHPGVAGVDTLAVNDDTNKFTYKATISSLLALTPAPSLASLTDVTLGAAAHQDVLMYDSMAGYWRNATAEEVVLGAGTNSVVLGPGATGSGDNTVSIGNTTSVTLGGVSIGYQAGMNTPGNYAVCLGYQAGTSSVDTDAVSIGRGSAAVATSGGGVTGQVAIGHASKAGTGCVSIGKSTGAGISGTTAGTTIIGHQAGTTIAAGNYGTAVGYQCANTNLNTQATCMGYRAGYTSSGQYAVLIGSTSNGGNDTVTIGTAAGVSTAAQAVIIGRAAGTATANNAVCMGYQAGQTAGAHGVSIGSSSSAAGIAAIALGSSANAPNDDGISIGSFSRSNTQGVSVGYQAGQSTPSAYAICIGDRAGNASAGDSSVIIGRQSVCQHTDSVVLGRAAQSTTNGQFVVRVNNAIANQLRTTIAPVVSPAGLAAGAGDALPAQPAVWWPITINASNYAIPLFTVT